MFEISRDLHVLAATDSAQFRHAGDLGRETNAARAMDAARHDGLDERPDIFVFDRALVLLVTAGVDTVSHRLVLQIAFAALIADRTIKRVVDQQEFHHAFARLFHHRGFGVEDFRRSVLVRRQILDAHGARRLRLRDADNLDETHAAIAGDRQTLVEAEARNLRTRSLAGLEQRVLRRDVDLFSVDNDLGHAACSLFASECAAFHNFAPGSCCHPNAWSLAPCAIR